MRELHDLIFQGFQERAENEKLTDDELNTLIDEELPGLLADFSNDIASEMLKRAPKQLKDLRKRERRFERRNYRRWAAGFDRLQLLIEISMDIGSLTKDDIGDAFQSSKAQALISLHARSLIVSRECLALMKAGFADGALGRWRTLHEIATVATFLSEHDDELSERYLVHRDVLSARAMKSYVAHQERANLTPISDHDLSDAIDRKDKILQHYGKEMDSEWGWAYPIIQRKRPKFSDLEEYCDLDHWRPRYKWASEDTHGQFRPPQVLLASVERQSEVILAGASNSGMVDPCQMVAITTRLSAASLLSLSDSLDFVAMIEVMGIISDQIGPLMMRDEKETLEKARNKQRKRK